jgi:hypothetical protein
MKNKQKEATINAQLSYVTVSAQTTEENTAQVVYVKSLKDMTEQEKKKEANKPLYLARYE